MKVVMTSFHNCIRVYKQYIALKKVGVEVHAILHHMANADLRTHYSSLSFYDEPEEYAYKIRELKDVDLIHVHNEPNWLGRIAKNQRPDIPVVFDAHDLDSIRQGIIDEDEQFVYKNCEGFIFPSEGYRTWCTKLHRLDPDRCEVIYSMCNEEHLQHQELPRLGGVVYQGGVGVADNAHPDLMGRDYRNIAKFFYGKGIPFTIFGASADYAEYYGGTAAICYGPQTYNEMIYNMTRYDWGLVGSDVRCSQRKNAVPNKLFEYMMAGLPVMCINTEEAGRFVTEHGVGVYLTDIRDIPTIYNDWPKYKKAVMEKRRGFLMEGQVSKILKMYEKAMEKKDAKDTADERTPGLGERGLRVCKGTQDCGCAFCDGTKHGMKYPRHGIQVESAFELLPYVRDANIIVFMHSSFVDFGDEYRGKRLFVFHGGTMYRQNPEQLNALFNPLVEKSLIQTADLLGLGAKNEVWVLPPVDTENIQPVYEPQADKPVIAHYPSNQWKGTDIILEAIDELKKEGLDFHFNYSAQIVPWEDNIKRMSQCDIYIDALCPMQGDKKYGEWGVQTLEAMALGKVVLSHGTISGPTLIDSIDQLKDKLLTYVGHCLGCTIPGRIYLGQNNREFVVHNHSCEAIGTKLKEQVFEI